MACTSCSKNGGTPAGCKNNGHCASGGCNKLEVYDWLSDMELPGGRKPFEIVEVRFKNGRKSFFRNTLGNVLFSGDVVAVEASPGYDVGVVTLSGELVKLQMEKRKVGFDSKEIRKIYRKASQEDIEKWKQAREQEKDTMHRARTIALNLGLEMKISDVEYQGDKTKAIFYYTAEGRVDFRELIKVLAEEFKVRVEMRQIGSRQEAARLGGIGSCGRELCCSTWLTDFRTVSTSAARYQQLSLNPQKLAGQCGKLKCCLNYELDMYVESFKEFPANNIKLQTKKGDAYHQKTDIFKKMMWYSIQGDMANQFVGLKIERVREIIEKNRKGVLVEDLNEFREVEEVIEEPSFENVVGQDSLTRFDEKRRKKKKKKRPGMQGAGQERSSGNDQPRPKKPMTSGESRAAGDGGQQHKPKTGNPNFRKGKRRPPKKSE